MNKSISIIIASIILSLASISATPSAGDEKGNSCEMFQSQEDQVQSPLAIYNSPPSSEVQPDFLNLSFPKAYLAAPWLPPRDDGLPDLSALFRLDYKTGQPVSPAELRQSLPATDSYILLLLTGRSYLDIHSQLKPMSGLFIDSKIDPEVRISSTERIGKFRKIYFPEQYNLIFIDNSYEHYVDADNVKDITSIMSCDKIDSVPLPHCYIKTRWGQINVKLSGFRRNETDNLPQILSVVDRFLGCLLDGDQ